MDKLLCELAEILRDHEPGLKRVVQGMFDLIQDNVNCSTQLMHKVISAVISGSQEHTSTRRHLLARALVCVQLQISRIPADDGALLLQELLTGTLDDVHPYTGQILEHLFENFVSVLGANCFLRLLDATRELLLSQVPQDCKSSNLLISKIQKMCKIGGEQSEALLNCLQCSAQQWTAFAVIIVDLKSQDSHLIVSTLEKQLPQLKLMSPDLGERWLAWLRTIGRRLLQEDRVQVLRKILKYFLAHLSVEQLVRLSLLSEFLVATNRSQLYDIEDYNRLEKKQLEQFVTDGHVETFLEALVTVSWENVPLLLWLRSFKSKRVQRVLKELLIKLSFVVRAIGNYDFRVRAQDSVLFLFMDTIDALSLRDYIVCMESLLNKADLYMDHDILGNKIVECNDLLNHMDLFNLRSYAIFSYHAGKLNIAVRNVLNTLILKCETFCEHMHGFWRLALFCNDQKLIMDFYRKFYKVDTSLLEKGATLGKMQAHLLERLDCQTSEETSFLKARCVDLFTSNLDSWRQLEDLNMDPLELLKQGSEQTMYTLTRLLGVHGNRIKNETILSALIPRVRYFRDIIEASSAFYLSKDVERNARIRRLAIENLNKYGNTEIKTKVFKELFKINEKLSMEHPHYTENSEVHRRKMRIASALITIREYCDDPISLKTLLLPSDHLGINLMHEFLVGTCVENIDWVLEALPSLQPRQQESYLSIAYIFIIKNFVKLNEEKKLSEMFSLLIPFIMGSINSTRILAQLILHKLAVKCTENR
ncbi:hypothetical protein KR059_003521 [Drosophila kikkawai]|nr:hypothetical protein KR059_003521 [Drosophila kikkawai]